jgi:hypothetical protein
MAVAPTIHPPPSDGLDSVSSNGGTDVCGGIVNGRSGLAMISSVKNNGF